MMPLWLDLLRTPMAAPETRSLRVARFGWQLLCLSSAGASWYFKPLHAAGGRAAAVSIAVLIIITLAVTVGYLRAKHRADNAYLDTLGAGE